MACPILWQNLGDIFAKKSTAPKSFENICPVLSFLEDIVENLNDS